jgi:catechol 2,3-dioxygenase-like lactoylglutathione lyase family enzyme
LVPLPAWAASDEAVGVLSLRMRQKIRQASDEAAGERGRAYVGPHHVGFLVDDLDEARRRVEQHGATFFMGAPELPRA